MCREAWLATLLRQRRPQIYSRHLSQMEPASGRHVAIGPEDTAAVRLSAGAVSVGLETAAEIRDCRLPEHGTGVYGVSDNAAWKPTEVTRSHWADQVQVGHVTGVATGNLVPAVVIFPVSLRGEADTVRQPDRAARRPVCQRWSSLRSGWSLGRRFSPSVINSPPSSATSARDRRRPRLGRVNRGLRRRTLELDDGATNTVSCARRPSGV